jgi:hypothetical protein
MIPYHRCEIAFNKSCDMPAPTYPLGHISDGKQLTLEDVHHAIKQGKEMKSASLDGINHEFFQAIWDIMNDDMLEIFQHMYTEGGIQPSQSHGLIVCLPKHDNPVTTDD